MPRKQKNIHYIYKTTCLVTNRYYIGAHSTLNLDDGYMGSGKRLRRSIRKYGENNHKKEILEFLPDREQLMEREKEIVNNDILKDDLCMNLVPGGKGGFTIEQQKLNSKKGVEKRKWLSENDIEWVTKKNNQLSLSQKQNYQTGKLIRKHFYDWTNHKHSNETKHLMSTLKKGTGIGKNNSQYGTCWITKDGNNKKIKKEELDIWINDGWDRGRKP